MKNTILRHIPLFALLLSAACAHNLPSAPAVPEYREGAIVRVDLRRWDSVNRNDSSDVKRLWDALHVMATVQGIVNRDGPVIYLDYVKAQGIDTDKFWFDKYAAPGKWLDGREVITLYDPVKVADMFRDRFKGLVVYDSDVASTSCVASTVAGVEDLIAVRYDTIPGSMYTRLIAHGYEPKVWLVGKNGEHIFHDKLEPYRWAVDNYLANGRCNPRFAAYYPDQFWRTCNTKSSLNHHQLSNHDFFVSRRSFFFDLSPWADEPATDAPGLPLGSDLEMMKTILSELYRLNGGSGFCHIGGFPAWAFKYSNHSGVGGRHLPTETEWEYTKIISAYNAYQDADALSFGAVANSSFWQHFPLEPEYPQKWVSREDLKKKGYLTADGKVDRSRKYYLIYVGDYDAASGVYQYGPKLWEDPMRGKVPMMWSISPALEYRAPQALAYFWETATENDYFAAADNGAGYLNPGMLESPRPVSGLADAVDAWEAYCEPLYKRWGLSITGFIIDGNGPGMSRRGFEAYSRFSGNGIVPQKTNGRLELVNGMPVLASEGGANNEDPAITARDIVAHLGSAHPDFPFYWYRAVFKQPSWFVSVHDLVQQQRSDAVWMSAPDFFELLRCYAEETGSVVPKAF